MTLAEYMKANALTDLEFAERLTKRVKELAPDQAPITQQSVQKWRNHQQVPKKMRMILIFECTDRQVTPNDFYDLEKFDGQMVEETRGHS